MDDKKHIVAITAVIKNQAEDKFLILKRSDQEIAFPGKWAFPGGKIEKGQTIIDTLRREVKEETGLDIADYKEYLKDYTFIRPDGHNVVGLTFLVKANSDNVTISTDFTEFAWLKPEKLSNYDHIVGMAEEIRIAFKK